LVRRRRRAVDVSGDDFHHHQRAARAAHPPGAAEPVAVTVPSSSSDSACGDKKSPVTLADAVRLIGGRDLSAADETWADLGAGDGTFTRALATVLPVGSVIHAMDRDAGHAALALPAGRDVRGVDRRAAGPVEP
jgi:hypothetical protein